MSNMIVMITQTISMRIITIREIMISLGLITVEKMMIGMNKANQLINRIST